jgi:lysophospholipase L1-like esterase
VRRLAAVLLGLGLLLVADLGLRPFVAVERKTTLFVRDADLGWRFRPGAVDVWDGVEYRINSKGLRSPEIDYGRRPGVRRLLYLGDSVTAGAGLPGYAEAFPHLAGDRLAARLRRQVETVNAGVNGYATWQEARFLATEGLRYRPDVVIVVFVPNDVTQRHGRHLAGSVASVVDRLANWSSLAALARKAAARLRFGGAVREGAVREQHLSVLRLTAEPEAPEVRAAWSEARRALLEVIQTCRRAGVPVGVVASPFAFQLDEPARLNAPQRELAAITEAERVPMLDLLPLLAAQARREGRHPGEYFLDHDHPSVLGSLAIADAVADFVAREWFTGDVADGRAAPGPAPANGPSGRSP